MSEVETDNVDEPAGPVAQATAPQPGMQTAASTLIEARGLPPLPAAVPLSNTLVALEGGCVVGVVVLEVAARRGLTAWLVVGAEPGNGSLPASLLRSLVSRAQELGLREIYAVARGTADAFAGVGFSPVVHDAVPGEIRSLKGYPEPQDDSVEILRFDMETRL